MPTKKKKTKRKTKKDAQKKLDRIAYWYGVWIMIGGTFWIMVIYAVIALSFNFDNIYLQIMVMMLTAIPATLWYHWQKRQKVKKPCPWCGSKLEVVRQSFNFSDTIVRCPKCKLESDRSQDWEGTPW